MLVSFTGTTFCNGKVWCTAAGTLYIKRFLDLDTVHKLYGPHYSLCIANLQSEQTVQCISPKTFSKNWTALFPALLTTATPTV